MQTASETEQCAIGKFDWWLWQNKKLAVIVYLK